jgi:hypothetical protein
LSWERSQQLLELQGFAVDLRRLPGASLSLTLERYLSVVKYDYFSLNSIFLMLLDKKYINQ